MSSVGVAESQVYFVFVLLTQISPPSTINDSSRAGQTMWLWQLIITLYSFAPLTLASRENTLVPINPDKIQNVLNVSTEALYKHANTLELFAKLDPDGNRAFGGLGHNLTVEYINNWFSQEGMLEYYGVNQVTFPAEYFEGTSILVIQGKTYQSSLFYYSPSTNGTLTAPLALVQNLGCNPVSTHPGLVVVFEFAVS